MGWLAFIDATIIFRDIPSKDQENRIFNIFLELSHGRRECIIFENREVDGTVKRCLNLHFSFLYNRREMLDILESISQIAPLENGTYFEFSDEDNDTWSFTYRDGKYIENATDLHINIINPAKEIFNMSSTAPIGAFDSGMGGMTVVKELMQQLPNEQIIYYGDTARVPYGDKSKETILTYARQIMQFLQTQGVKAIIVACNTVSAVALEDLKNEFDLPVIGVVKPGARAAAEATHNNRIGVIATRATINSGIYREFLCRTNPDIEVFQQACPLFVPLVEEGWIDNEITDMIIHRYLDDLMKNDIDSLVLGCTHYPLLRDRIRMAVGPDINLVNPAFESSREFKYVLEENRLLNERDTPHAPHRFYVSDGAARFAEFAARILGDNALTPEDVTVHNFE